MCLRSQSSRSKPTASPVGEGAGSSELALSCMGEIPNYFEEDQLALARHRAEILSAIGATTDKSVLPFFVRYWGNSDQILTLACDGNDANDPKRKSVGAIYTVDLGQGSGQALRQSISHAPFNPVVRDG